MKALIWVCCACPFVVLALFFYGATNKARALANTTERAARRELRRLLALNTFRIDERAFTHTADISAVRTQVLRIRIRTFRRAR